MSFETKLSQEDQDFAKKDIGEHASSRQTAINILKDRIALHPGLKANTDDAFLVGFLRARKYDIDRAMTLVENFYDARNDPLIFNDFRPSTLTVPFNLGFSTAMDGYNSYDRTKIIVLRPGQWKAGDETHPFVDSLRCHSMVIDHVLRDEVVQVRGIRMVIDTADVGFDHLKELAKGWPRMMTRLIQDSTPVRLKGIHYINEPPLMSQIFALIRPFLKEKLVKRVQFHGHDIADLHKYVSPDCLPQHLQGSLPALPHANFTKTIMESEAYFVEMYTKYYLDDPKALFKSSQQDAQDSGVVGSFKKLSVD